MSQNKRQKMNLGAACSSASVNTREMSTSVLDDSEAHIAQQTARSESQTNEKQKNVIFDENKTSFKEAVKWSGFVDKTLLIAELLRIPRHAIILTPKRFGKTLNINMVKCFLEIEAGRDVSCAPQNLEDLKRYENFQAFCRYGLAPSCKILNKIDLVKEYFGRHPVLHIDFKNVKIDSIQDVEDDVRELVHEAYLEHFYLINGGNEWTQQTCQIWCSEVEYKKKDAIFGIQGLIEYLHVYHKRKVYLLIDGFNAPAVNASLAGKSRDEVNNISNEIMFLLGAAVKGTGASKHLLGSLIAGVSSDMFPLRRVYIYHDLNNVPVYKWSPEDRGRFFGYYGLSNDELTTLLEHVFPDQEQKRRSVQEEVVDLYNGHYFDYKSAYCLWTVLHYIQVRSTLDSSRIAEKSFWGGSRVISEMGKLLRSSEIKEKTPMRLKENFRNKLYQD